MKILCIDQNRAKREPEPNRKGLVLVKLTYQKLVVSNFIKKILFYYIVSFTWCGKATAE